MTTSTQTTPNNAIVQIPLVQMNASMSAEQRIAFSVGGFCNCDNGHKARGIPAGAKLLAEARLNFRITGDEDERGADSVYTKGDGQLYVSYDFHIATLEFEDQWVNLEIQVGAIGDWPNFATEPLVLLQMLNSASNVFSLDTSIGAERLRADVVSYELGPVRLVNDHFVAIEVGKDADGSGWNVITRFLTPSDSEYLEVMQFNTGVAAGTGPEGQHMPPAGLVMNAD